VYLNEEKCHHQKIRPPEKEDDESLAMVPRIEGLTSKFKGDGTHQN